MIRFKKNYPRFVGFNEIIFGPYNIGDIVEFKGENKIFEEFFIKNGFAERVETQLDLRKWLKK